jgi:hypothetical protein
MISEFYLINHSFRSPQSITVEELENRIADFSEDCEFIRRYDSEKIFVHDSIYGEYIYKEITVMDLMYNPIHKETFNKDTLEYLRIIVQKAETTELSEQEIQDNLGNHSKDRVSGLLCLYEIEFIDKAFLVYNRHNWLAFHRYFLGLYPKNASFFFLECQKYFPQLYFHPKNKESIDKILSSFVKKIVFHLTCLNDVFKEIRSQHNFLPDALKEFSIFCNLDETATLEGNASRKKDLSFYFTCEDGKQESVYCEPHLKLCRSDNYEKGDNTYYNDKRIYFHEGKPHIAQGRILIGHIGEHL